MKRIKLILILIILVGIVFSISNFMSIEIKASSERGKWIRIDGEWECTGIGTQCDLGGGLPEEPV